MTETYQADTPIIVSLSGILDMTFLEAPWLHARQLTMIFSKFKIFLK